jgi:hypothetical protein
MPRIIKNTLYHYAGWIDIDQVKGHPTLLLEIAKRTGERIPSYEDYLAPVCPQGYITSSEHT